MNNIKPVYYFDLNRELEIYNENFLQNIKAKIQGWFLKFLAFIKKIKNRIKILFFKIKTMIKKKMLNAKIKLIDFPEPSQELKDKINKKICKYGVIMDINYLKYYKDDNVYDIDKIINAINNISFLNKESDFDKLIIGNNLGVSVDPVMGITEKHSRVNNIDTIRKIFTDISNENIKSFNLFYDNIFSSLDKLTDAVDTQKNKIFNSNDYNDYDYTEKKYLLLTIEKCFNKILKNVFKKINDCNRMFVLTQKKYAEVYNKIITYNQDGGEIAYIIIEEDPSSDQFKLNDDNIQRRNR